MSGSIVWITGAGRAGFAYDEREWVLLFHVLGPVEIRTPDGVVLDARARKPITVLTALLSQVNAWTPVDRLIAATWPEQATPASAEANLKTYIWQLRRILPPPATGKRIESRPGAYRLRVEHGDLDTDHAERLATEARLALAAGDAEGALAGFTRALDLWRGTPFEHVAVDAGVLTWLGELRSELREGLADAYAALGRVAEATAVLRGLTDDDPLRESAWARWMRVLSEVGRHGAALAVYARASAVLMAELGVEPGPDLSAARAGALRGQADVADGPSRAERGTRACTGCTRLSAPRGRGEEVRSGQG